MRTLDQIRAEYAWGRVTIVDPGFREKYRNLAKSLPALVMSNGLMQTLAFLEGKGKGEHGRLRDDILKWLAGDQAAVLAAGTGSFRSAMTAFVAMNSLEYQRATEEALAVLRWIRQLADTVVAGEGR